MKSINKQRRLKPGRIIRDGAGHPNKPSLEPDPEDANLVGEDVHAGERGALHG